MLFAQMIWKEKKHAWVQEILAVGKISINMALWILSFAVYSKSSLFAAEAKRILQQPEYASNDILASEKIQMVHMVGMLTVLMASVGIVFLFICISRSDIKKCKSHIMLLHALGYGKRELKKYYAISAFMDVVGSIPVACLISWVAWNGFLLCAPKYIRLLKEVGLSSNMDWSGILPVVLFCMIIRIICTVPNAHSK